MTTEDDFQAALDADPDDWQTRLVFADWLEERGDERGPGYRALGLHRHRPPRGNGYVWFNAAHYGRVTFDNLPADWFEELEDETDGASDAFRAWSTRREAEDAAAWAFAELPPERRAELLAAPLLRGDESSG
jgi:uncharacterized protein (TIGR02996 family)